MRVVHRKVGRGERELTSIENAGGRFFGVVHFLNYVARNFLRWIAIIGGESIEHLFAPDPVLKHLRWRFYEIAGDMRSGEASGLRSEERRVGKECRSWWGPQPCTQTISR